MGEQIYVVTDNAWDRFLAENPQIEETLKKRMEVTQTFSLGWPTFEDD